MSSILPRSVRVAFVTLLLGLTVYTIGESIVGRSGVVAQAPAAQGLSTCGTDADPCSLEAITIVAEPAPATAQVAATQGLSSCGSDEQPCAMEPIVIEAERQDARLASSGRALGMTLRAGS